MYWFNFTLTHSSSPSQASLSISCKIPRPDFAVACS
nr:MAG TPA: hypothetical protein [Caudoviricetes sp.]